MSWKDEIDVVDTDGMRAFRRALYFTAQLIYRILLTDVIVARLPTAFTVSFEPKLPEGRLANHSICTSCEVEPVSVKQSMKCLSRRSNIVSQTN